MRHHLRGTGGPTFQLRFVPRNGAKRPREGPFSFNRHKRVPLSISCLWVCRVPDPHKVPKSRIFSHIGKIDHAGSGLNAIWRTCERSFGVLPRLEERFLPMPEVELTVPLSRDLVSGLSQQDPSEISLASSESTQDGASDIDAASDNASDNRETSDNSSVASDTLTDRRGLILSLIEQEGQVAMGAIAPAIGLSAPRTRAILAEMVGEGLIEAHGGRRGRYYTLPADENGG